MTTNIPLSSTQIANDKAAPKMRFLYPLAAVCLAAVFMSPGNGEAQTSAPKLRADQERAIELALKEVEPAMRPMARQQLAISFANFNEAQIAMMVAKMNENRAESAARPVPVAEVETVSTPEDSAFMRAQYEPVMRKHHAVQKAFDQFANAKIDAYCPKDGKYARFGSAWRYEQAQFVMPVELATWNVESNVAIAREALEPKHGRYRFDFAKVRMSYDEKKVDAEIKRICDKVHAAGRSFLATVDPLIAREDWNGAFVAEQKANFALEPIRAEWKKMIDTMSPGDFSEIQLAMMNGKRVKS
jgi:hypothetical protein